MTSHDRSALQRLVRESNAIFEKRVTPSKPDGIVYVATEDPRVQADSVIDSLVRRAARPFELNTEGFYAYKSVAMMDFSVLENAFCERSTDDKVACLVSMIAFHSFHQAVVELMSYLYLAEDERRVFSLLLLTMHVKFPVSRIAQLKTHYEQGTLSFEARLEFVALCRAGMACRRDAWSFGCLELYWLTQDCRIEYLPSDESYTTFFCMGLYSIFSYPLESAHLLVDYAHVFASVFNALPAEKIAAFDASKLEQYLCNYLVTMNALEPASVKTMRFVECFATDAPRRQMLCDAWSHVLLSHCTIVTIRAYLFMRTRANDDDMFFKCNDFLLRFYHFAADFDDEWSAFLPHEVECCMDDPQHIVFRFHDAYFDAGDGACFPPGHVNRLRRIRRRERRADCDPSASWSSYKACLAAHEERDARENEERRRTELARRERIEAERRLRKDTPPTPLPLPLAPRASSSEKKLKKKKKEATMSKEESIAKAFQHAVCLEAKESLRIAQNEERLENRRKAWHVLGF